MLPTLPWFLGCCLAGMCRDCVIGGVSGGVEVVRWLCSGGEMLRGWWCNVGEVVRSYSDGVEVV